MSACQTFAKCADDPQVLELFQRCFVKIKTAKQTTVISHESRAKNWKKEQQQFCVTMITFYDHGIQESFEVSKQICDMSTFD